MYQKDKANEAQLEPSQTYVMELNLRMDDS